MPEHIKRTTSQFTVYNFIWRGFDIYTFLDTKTY
jgi:hypothetical protein